MCDVQYAKIMLPSPKKKDKNIKMSWRCENLSTVYEYVCESVCVSVIVSERGRERERYPIFGEDLAPQEIGA